MALCSFVDGASVYRWTLLHSGRWEVSDSSENLVFVYQSLWLELVRNRQTQQINKIDHELQGVLYKVRQDDMFRSI